MKQTKIIKKEKKVEHVMMYREKNTNPEPYEVLVHINEVENWKKYGWELVNPNKD